ncbi:hypothetical protein WMF27_32110 [Sorangium sp. So ce281]|uniref:hypothetical protein n=1 Tax=unclassified Sorangium TaxID=2621164 RepID=UPI003F5E4F08
MNISLLLVLIAVTRCLPPAIEFVQLIRTARAEGRPIDWRAVLLLALKVARPAAELLAPVVERLLDQ